MPPLNKLGDDILRYISYRFGSLHATKAAAFFFLCDQVWGILYAYHFVLCNKPRCENSTIALWRSCFTSFKSILNDSSDILKADFKNTYHIHFNYTYENEKTNCNCLQPYLTALCYTTGLICATSGANGCWLNPTRIPLQEMFWKTSTVFKKIIYIFALKTVLISISTGPWEQQFQNEIQVPFRGHLFSPL